LSIQ
jgi:hypothetical protein